MLPLTAMELQAKSCEGDDYDQWNDCQSSYTWGDGDQYSGGWDNGKMNGYGTYNFAADNAWQMESYSGFYLNDDMHGIGKIVWLDGGYYEGDFSYNDPHGYGTHVYASGNKYEGYYKNGQPEGEGKYSWLDESSYSGSWKNGDYDGYGVFKYSDGDTYEGFFESDQKHGKGKMTYADGSIYEGDWVNGEIVTKDESEIVISEAQVQCPSDTSLTWTNCIG